MPAFKHKNWLGLLALCLYAAGAASAQAHEHARAPRAELAISAAADAQGRLWVIGKETTAAGQYLVLRSSSDTGRTWSAARRVQRQPEAVSADGENRPKIAFGGSGEIYISYTRPLSKPYTGEIRFIRSTDGGKTFSAPRTVHANRDEIAHRFDSLIVDRRGRIFVAWIDKRDREEALRRKRPYAGAALYYAVSDDQGASFKGDYKVADHSCECCRIALALNPHGEPVALWRHVFEPNARDHALVKLTPDGNTAAPVRASFDDWRIDACPHQGPSLAYAANGTRHQVWFNLRQGEGGVFHAHSDASGALGTPLRLGSAQAQHADVVVAGADVVLAWTQFDGSATALMGRWSTDGGATWRDAELARTRGAADHARLLNAPSGIVLIWNTQQEGIRTIPFNGGD